MAISCPNINHPDWKKLEKMYGKQRALRMFAENNFEIPKIGNSYKKTVVDFLSGMFTKATTMDLLKNNPQMGMRIVDKLKSLYPNVRIFKDGLFDEKGNWVAIPPGQAGMHYRNAFYSAVAWANDSYLETPPHEYAHEYIDMFRANPLVQKALSKYSEEMIVSFMGKYFAGREMSNPVKNFIADFWYMVRSLFGATDIKEELAREFYKGNKLGPESAGTGIYSYQEKNKPYTRAKGAFEVDGKFNESVLNGISYKEARMMIMNDEIGPNVLNPGEVPTPHQVESGIMNLILKLKSFDTADNNFYRNVASIDYRLLDDVMKGLRTEDTARRIGQELFGMDEVQLTEDERKMLDTIISAKQRLEYLKVANESIHTVDNNIVPLDEVRSEIIGEIEKTAQRREQLYKKIPKPMQKFVKNMEKLLRYQLVPRLIAKYLSGSEASTLSKIFYKALDNASKKYDQIRLQFDDTYAGVDLPKWSEFNSPKMTIDDYDTYTIDGYVGEGNSSKNGPIKLTKAEALVLYMMLRQNDETAGTPPPATTVITKGFHLGSIIEDRNIGVSKEDVIHLMPGEADKIKTYFETAPEYVEVISKIDKALDDLYQHTSKTYKIETGQDLPKVNNYFPVSTGPINLEQRSAKNIIEQFRAGNARLGEDKPLRIDDVNKVLSFHKANGALYASHAIEIMNLRKVLNGLDNKYEGTQEAIYIDDMKSLIKQIEDNSPLYSGRGEKDIESALNRITANFSVAVLGMNIGTMLKQPLGYLAAKEEIDSRFLAKAGWGVGGIVGIKPGQIWRSIAFTGVKGGQTLLPVEWKMDTSNPVYKEILEHSSRLRTRLEGATSRETGEALMDEQRGNDKVVLPFKYKNGEKVYISKHRLMEGIKIFDSATMMAIWKAVKLETAEKYPDLVEGSEAYWEHVSERTEEIVAKTQSAYELPNRSSLSRMRNPLVRLVTMFSSQSSLLGNLMVDGTISYINNPTKENKRKLFKRTVNIMVTTSLAMAVIDALKHGVTHGFDDDDELSETILMSSVMNSFSNIYGLSQLSRLIISRMDNQPWMAKTQTPVEALVDAFGTGLYDIFRGYKLDRHGNYQELTIDDGLFKIGKAMFMAKGLPISPFNDVSAVYKNVTE